MATPMVMMSQRPVEVEDRAVPGHWEGDLIIGASNQSAIGTLLERSTRFVLLLPLPNGYGPAAVRDALTEKIQSLPVQMRRSLTWDHGTEMHLHGQFTDATAMPVYFCDPHSPWQRGRGTERATPQHSRLGHPSRTHGYTPDHSLAAVLQRPLERRSGSRVRRGVID
jgi:IS30 family transposase